MVTEIYSNHIDAHVQNSTHATQNTNIKARSHEKESTQPNVPIRREDPRDPYSLAFPFGGTKTNM